MLTPTNAASQLNQSSHQRPMSLVHPKSLSLKSFTANISFRSRCRRESRRQRWLGYRKSFRYSRAGGTARARERHMDRSRSREPAARSPLFFVRAPESRPFNGGTTCQAASAKDEDHKETLLAGWRESCQHRGGFVACSYVSKFCQMAEASRRAIKLPSPFSVPEQVSCLVVRLVLSRVKTQARAGGQEAAWQLRPAACISQPLRQPTCMKME